ncbi:MULTISPECIES: hypothetical protein [unclassified Gilliamella]|nr:MULTISPECIES: hypothetical protein [unclassified Gilliamella]
MALSDALVKNCKPKSKAYTLKDIEVWRYMYRLQVVNHGIFGLP